VARRALVLRAPDRPGALVGTRYITPGRRNRDRGEGRNRQAGLNWVAAEGAIVARIHPGG
jgi:hypothetical protein